MGSQPVTYTMEQGTLMPSLVLLFAESTENLKSWIYTKELGQEFFPTTATVQETFFSKDQGLTCAPDPKGCEGRVLRWFDMGTLPSAYKGPEAYLYRVNTGVLKPEEWPKKVSYVDVGIGVGNQIKVPQIAAKDGHVYYVVLVPEGAPLAIGPVELNLEDAGEREQFQKTAMNKEYRFVRGIWVKSPLGNIYQTLPAAREELLTPVKIRATTGDSK